MTKNAVRLVSDPCAEYDSLKPIWQRARSVCGGEGAAKAADRFIDTISYKNLLLPFSPSMTQEQYRFYVAEAELPGITTEFVKMIIGGLLRKPPVMTLPDSVPEEAEDWLTNEFSEDGLPILAFLDAILLEEVVTSRSWVYVDYPLVENPSVEDAKNLRPYPVVWPAESVINWRVAKGLNGKMQLSQVIVRTTEEVVPDSDENFHPEIRQIVCVHELDQSGLYQIRKYVEPVTSPDDNAVAGRRATNTLPTASMVLEETFTDFMVNGERLNFIPAWPLSGQIEASTPILMPIIDKEVALYNKVSRRNHLLLGAATYTPVIFADLTDTLFQDIVKSGLGSWIKLPVDAKVDVLKTPTEALADMDRAIASGIEEIARLGVRMLSPESEQSGVALNLRNASQTARLSSLSAKVSSTMQSVIAFMLSWKYNVDVKAKDVTFKLSEDFSANPMSVQLLNLVSEWYQNGLIPRSAWLDNVKRAEILRPEYDDERGLEEVVEGMDMIMPKPVKMDKI